MKIIPKFQGGGGFDSLFTVYNPATQRSRQQQASHIEKSTKSESNEDKGKLTEKDLFTMLKDIKGLPNEMKSIVSNLIDTLSISKMTGVGLEDLSTTYLQSLYKITQATDNKAMYDEAYKKAVETGSMTEPAITANGELVVQDNSGKVQKVTLENFVQNKDKYRNILTVSNLLNLRAYDPSFAYDYTVFDTVNSSMGYSAFQKLIKEAVGTLGSSQITRGMMSSESELASKGLDVLSQLKESDQIQPGTQVSSDSLYKYKIIDQNQKKQIDYLTSYISALLPENAKIWAAIKLRTSDKEKATSSLITTYLSSGETTVSEVTMQPTKGGRGSTDEEDPKEGFWRQVQSGKGGTEDTFNLLVGKSHLSVDGKLYGAVPGITQNCSLGDYINSSNVGYIIKDPKKITFGDINLSTDSFNDVMINTSSGAFVVKLPIDQSGKVNFAILDEYAKITDELKKEGLKEGTREYQFKEAQLLKSKKLDMLIDPSTGLPNPRYFGNFLVLEGLTSSKAYGVQSIDGKKESFDDIDSTLIINAGDNDELYDSLRKGLSNKDRGEYELDNNLWSWNNDKLYRGNIYIPLNTNPLNAVNADNNDIRTSTALEYERAQQILSKRINQGDIGSNLIE